jgi:hypothetical protein
MGATMIDALAFSDDDKMLYVGTKSEDVSADPDTKKYEILNFKRWTYFPHRRDWS